MARRIRPTDRFDPDEASAAAAIAVLLERSGSPDAGRARRRLADVYGPDFAAWMLTEERARLLNPARGGA